VVDEGGGFEPGATTGTAVPEPLPGDDELSVGGLGLAIIDAISDELAITKGGSGGSTLRFVKHLS
jgi:anti-sigma regulatory factor (Ser/Thr protein kinase)